MAAAAALFLLGCALAAIAIPHAGFAHLAWAVIPCAAAGGYALHRSARASPTLLSKGYTRALVVVAFSLILAAAVLHDPDQYDEDLRATMTLVHRFDLVLAGACLLTAALRYARSRFALPATAALSPLLLFVLPLGTAAALWWMFAVRGREATVRSSEA